MVLKEFDQARLLPENQDPKFQTALNDSEGILLTKGVTWPIVGAETVFDFDREWERQEDTLAGLFAKPLKMSQSEYKDRYFGFRFPQPEKYKGRFDTLTLVQTPVARKLPLSRILEIVGISKGFAASSVKNWSESKFQTPNAPYATWLHDGKPNLGKTVAHVRDTIANDERGGKSIDGVSHFIQNPAVLNDHFIDFPGDQVGADNAPYLNRWNDEPCVRHYWVALPRSKYGSMVAGVEIGTRPLDS